MAITSTGLSEGPLRLLLVEDEPKLAALIKRGLNEAGYAVDLASDASEGLWRVSETNYDLVVLDVMLPDSDGFKVCASIRASGFMNPVLMLTARDDINDRVRGLDSGADDYLTKPFDFEELLARLRALSRRPGGDRDPVLRVGALWLDPASHQTGRGEVAIELTAKEFALLHYLMRNPGRVLSRRELIDHAWDFAFESDSNVVDVYVRYLREKIDRPFGVETLVTVRGVGYRLQDEAKSADADQN
ncbi:MAG: response regulator transcription factor [Actinomycetes bacterium]